MHDQGSGSEDLSAAPAPGLAAAEAVSADIAGLLSGYRWNKTELTYSFPQTAGDYGSTQFSYNEPTYNFQPLNPTQVAAAEAILAHVSSFTGLAFTGAATAGGGDLRFGTTQRGTWAYYPGDGAGGDLWFQPVPQISSPRAGNQAYWTFLHEIGHALGLKHGHESPALTPEHNSWEFSLMTYSSYVGDNPLHRTEGGGFPRTYMMYDMAALQHLYGANYAYNSGDTVYRWDQNGTVYLNGVAQGAPAVHQILMTVWDGGGSDTYDLSDHAGGVVIDLRPGGWTKTSDAQLVYLEDGHYARGNIANALLHNGDKRSLIENAIGGAGNDQVTGNEADNLFFLDRGGDDIADGGEGNDAFYLGAAFGSADRVKGGAGSDQLGLQGNYSGLVLADGTLDDVETLAVLSGTITGFGDASAGPERRYGYDITAADGNVVAGEMLTVQSQTLVAGESFTFNGAAEADGSFIFFAGRGAERLTGGQGNDAFFFGEGAFSTATDRVDGHSGSNDQLGLRGDYSALVIFQAETMTGMEALVFLSASDVRFAAGGSSFHYNVKTHDGNVAAGALLTVTGVQLTPTETMVFDGSSETDGRLRILGGSGNDRLMGGGGEDILYGGLGADTLQGLSGGDVFLYRSSTDSTAGSMDRILLFGEGDRVDLSAIDANSATTADDAFRFIGGDAFTGTAGELRLRSEGDSWIIEGDVDGDTIADLLIGFTTIDSVIASAHFVL